MEPLLRRDAHRSLIEQRKTELIAGLARIVPRAGIIVLEIGCGHGHFLVAYATAHPHACCVGIDLVGERIDRAERKRDRAKLPNLHFVRADAQLFLDALAEIETTVSDIFLLFPDPWPKKRHHKHRVVQPEFLTALASRAGRGARVCFRTDHRPYFLHAQATFREHPAWRLVDEPWPFEHETVFQRRAADFSSLVARARTPQP